MSARRWAPWWVALLGGVTACSLMVGEADLASVQCMQEGVVGPPACKDGQACLAGRCQQCSAVEACGDNLDNDCNGKPDDGCSAAGSGGSAGQAGAEQGGSAGMDASPDQSVGGSSGQAGEGGGAGQGGVAGQSGEGGASAGGAAGEGGGAGGSAGGQAGTGGQPPLSKLGGPCLDSTGCEPGLFCGASGVLSGVCTKSCCTSGNCGPNYVCIGAFGGGACAYYTAVTSGSLGPGLPGSQCDGPDDCRSGRCAGGICNDTCCAQSDCAGGSQCAVRDDDITVWECQKFGAGGNDENAYSDCTSGSECKSNMCYLLMCREPCCGGCSFPFSCSYSNGTRMCVVSASSNTPCCTDADCDGGKHCVPVNNLLQCQ